MGRIWLVRFKEASRGRVGLRPAKSIAEKGSKSRRKTLIPVWNLTREAPILSLCRGLRLSLAMGRKSKRAMDYDGENNDEGQEGEQHSDEDLGTSHSKENVGEFEALSQKDLAAGLLYDNHWSTTDRDPLVESIHTLRSAQEELEKGGCAFFHCQLLISIVIFFGLYATKRSIPLVDVFSYMIP